jgi:exopolysaccharide biosynthesis polyprenyl glycosylphosphotransferase
MSTQPSPDRRYTPSSSRPAARLPVGFPDSDKPLHRKTAASTWTIEAGEEAEQTLASATVGARARKRILIVGYTEVSRALATSILSNGNSGCEVIGFIDDEPHPDVLGATRDLLPIARRHFVDEIVIAKHVGNELKHALDEARREHMNMVLIPESVAVFGTEQKPDSLAGFPTLVIYREEPDQLRVAIKRCLDIACAAVGLVLLSPLFLVIALLVKLDSRGPIFYAHTRVGKKGRHFTCFKFRTMIPNADDLKNELRHLNELGNGFFFKIQRDPRLTKVGSVLRRYSLDELPQLFNILRGDMSLVGPRPSPIDEFKMYDIPHFRRLDVRPGLTGLWQIVGRRDPDFDRAMKVDREYVDRWSLWLDLKILMKTFSVIDQGE